MRAHQNDALYTGNIQVVLSFDDVQNFYRAFVDQHNHLPFSGLTGFEEGLKQKIHNEPP